MEFGEYTTLHQLMISTATFGRTCQRRHQVPAVLDTRFRKQIRIGDGQRHPMRSLAVTKCEERGRERAEQAGARQRQARAEEEEQRQRGKRKEELLS